MKSSGARKKKKNKLRKRTLRRIPREVIGQQISNRRIKLLRINDGDQSGGKR